MKLGDHQHNDGHDTSPVTAGPAVFGISVILIGFIVTFLLMHLDTLRPKIGDMVVFQPTTQPQDVWQIDVSTYRPTARGQATCTMDPAVIVRQGGSLVVEARDDAAPDAEYRLHWAGAHSANGAGDCTGSADLAMSRADLQRLANAAGGFGIETGLVR